MPKKPQPIEHFARGLEAISLAKKKCGKLETAKCIMAALESAEKNLIDGLQGYRGQQARDAQFFADVGGYSILRGADCEKADEILKKISD